MAPSTPPAGHGWVADRAPQYRPLAKGDAPAPTMPPSRALAIAGAPFLASRAVFPKRLARAVRRLSADPRGASIPFVHAERFFGRRLVVDIDPARLTRHLRDLVSDGSRSLRLAHRFLDAADWTPATIPLDDMSAHREMVQLARSGEDFRRTGSYRRLLANAGRDAPHLRNQVSLKDEAVIDAYFEHYMRLVASIRENGVKRREAVPRAAEGKAPSIARPSRAEREEREVGVAIGPEGEMLRFLGGRHRTAIAQALGLRSMPVEVRLVHVAWLRRIAEEAGLRPHAALAAWFDRFSA